MKAKPNTLRWYLGYAGALAFVVLLSYFMTALLNGVGWAMEFVRLTEHSGQATLWQGGWLVLWIFFCDYIGGDD